MPGQRKALARSPHVPWQLTLENCQLLPASPQSSFHKPERIHVFAEPTLQQNVARGNRKAARLCEQAVDDETSLWTSEEKRAKFLARKFTMCIFNNLDDVKEYDLLNGARAGWNRPLNPVKVEVKLKQPFSSQISFHSRSFRRRAAAKYERRKIETNI